jgi:hypothetical protein
MAPRHAITPAKRDGMLRALRGGALYRDAAEAAGIPWRTWMDWCAAVRDDACSDPDVVALVTEARIAYHATNTGLTAAVAKAGMKDWRAAAWLSEHRQGAPKAAADARRAQHEATIAKNRAEGTHVETVRHVGELADDELDRRIHELEAATKH